MDEKGITTINLVFIVIIASIGIVSVFSVYSISQSLSDVMEEKQNLEAEITDIQNKINSIHIQIKQVNQDLNETLSEIMELQETDRYELHDPLYWEAWNFIVNKDWTERQPYDNETFNCVHYAKEVNNNAEKEGIRCGYVDVAFTGGPGHAIVAFNTIHRGIVFYDPQTNERVDLHIGEDYWSQCVITEGNYYYEPSGNIVEGFTIYW